MSGEMRKIALLKRTSLRCKSAVSLVWSGIEAQELDE